MYRISTTPFVRARALHTLYLSVASLTLIFRQTHLQALYLPIHLAVSMKNSIACALLLKAVAPQLHTAYVMDTSLLREHYVSSGVELASVDEWMTELAVAPSPFLLAALRGNASVLKVSMYLSCWDTVN